MTYWTWDQELSVNIDEIDHQHQRIIEYINELDVAYRSDDQKMVDEVLNGLIDYTLTHFAFEEEMMERAGYPITDLHKSVHHSFITDMKRYKQQHDHGHDVTRQLMSELQIWLTCHIKKEDKDYSPYVLKLLHKSWFDRTIGRFFKSH